MDQPSFSTIGYCVKCKARTSMKDEEKVEMAAKGGKTRPAVKGVCCGCGTEMYKILPG